MDSVDNELFHLDADTWLESETIGGFRVWHIIAVCFSIVLSIIIMVCCCFRFRIPRTKQEIEADFQRKQITKRFREKLQHIKNSEMDDMNLQKAIERIYADLQATQSATTVDEQHHMKTREELDITNVKLKSTNIQNLV